MDVDRYRYRTFISDIAGFDIEEHNGSVAKVITVIRNWLRHANAIKFEPPGGATIHTRYQAFQLDLPKTCNDMDWDIDNLTFADFSWAAYDWIKNNPL